MLKTFFVILTLVSFTLAGHIYVDDVAISYQNTGFVTSATIRFMLESGLGQSNYLKVVWPFTWSVTSGTAVLAPADSTFTIDASSSGQTWSFLAKSALSANKWYSLTVTAAAASTSNQLYNDPIQIWTASSVSSNALIYDFNTVAGFVAVAAAPVDSKTFKCSSKAEKTETPSSVAANKKLEASYTIYCDIQPTLDHIYGAKIRLVSTQTGFYQFSGSCKSSTNACAATGADPTCVNTTASATGVCSLVSTTSGSDTITGSLTLTYPEPMFKDLFYRIETTIKNGKLYSTTTGSIDAYIASNVPNVDMYYEKKTSNSDYFGLDSFTITDKAIFYFWGLNADAGTTTCKIGLYRDSFFGGGNIEIYNKIQLYFAISSAMPSSLPTGTDYKVTVGIPSAQNIPFGSFATDLTIVSGKSLAVTTSGSAATLKAELTNIANPTSLQSFIAFAVNYPKDPGAINHALNATALSAFGKIEFFQGATSVGASAGYSITPIHNDEFSYVDSTWNALAGKGLVVIDLAEADRTQLITDQATKSPYDNILKNYMLSSQLASSKKGRNAIQLPTSGTVNLLFLINPHADQQCCKVRTSQTTSKANNCAASADETYCNTPTSSKKNPYLLMKLIANPGAITFGTTFNSDGIQLLGGGLFSADVTTALSPNFMKPCLAVNKCAVWNHKMTTAEQLGNKTFNYWAASTAGAQNGINEKQFYHLSYTCGDETDQPKYCVTTANDLTTAFNSPAFVIPKVALSSSFKINPLYPSDTDIDFILCFRYQSNTAGTGTFALDPSGSAHGTLASSGVIQAMVVNAAAKKETFFTVAQVNQNFFTSTYNTFAVNPTLLRVGGYFNTAEFASCTHLGVFFDSAWLFERSILDSTYQFGCSSSTDTAAPACMGYDNSAAFPAAAIFGYYPSMKRYYIKPATALAAGAFFNFYILAPGSVKNPTLIDLALLNSNAKSNFDGVKIYQVFGFVQGQASNLYAALTAGGTNAADSGHNVGTENLKSATFAPTFIDTTFPEASLYGGFSNGTNFLTSISGGQFGATKIYQNAIATPYVDDDGIYRGKDKWGAHLIITSINDKYWGASTLDWGYKSTVAADPKSECAQITYKLAAAGSLLRYSIVCPVDKGTTAITTFDKKLGVTKFELPFYLGTVAAGITKDGAYFNSIVGYAWTEISGVFGAFSYQKLSTGVTVTTCTVGALTTVYNKLGNAQKLSFTTSINKDTKALLTLQKSGSVGQSFVIGFTPLAKPAEWTYSYSQCLADNSLTCSFTSGGPSFTLTSTATTTTQQLSSQDIKITFWVDVATYTTAASTTYTGYLEVWNPTLPTPAYRRVNDCATGVTLSGSSSDYAATLTVGKPTFYFTKAARGPFAFTFTIIKPLWDFSSFQFTFSFFATANTATQASNIQCNIMEGNSYSFIFDTLSYTDLTATTATLKTGLAASDRDLAKSSFSFRCIGSLTPTTIATTDYIQVIHKTSAATIATGYDTGYDTATSTITARVVEALVTPSETSTTLFSVDITKEWNDPGMEANYIFGIKVNDNTKSFGPGIWVHVEFSYSTPPKFNYKGILYCDQYQDSQKKLIPTFCEFVDNHRIRILTNNVINNVTNQIKVYGVGQPKTFDAYKKVYVAFDSNSDANDGVIWQTEVTEPTAGTAAPTTVQILDYNVSSNATRSVFGFDLRVNLPQTTVIEQQELFVQLDGYHVSAFYKSFTPTCQLYAYNADMSVDATNNYVSACSYYYNGLIFLNLTLDSKNAAATMRYKLSVSGIPGPFRDVSGFTSPQIIIPTKGTTTVKLLSAPGNNNITYRNFGNAGGIVFLAWGQGQIDAKQGLYTSPNTKDEVVLAPADGKKFGADLTFTTTATAKFAFFPTSFTVVVGQPDLKFILAPKASTAPGLEYVELKLTNTGYAQIEPLRVKITSEQCGINYPNNGLNVPANGGMSLPYILDFTPCQPESKVGIAMYTTNTTQNISHKSPNVTFGDDSSKMVGTVVFGTNKQILFSLKSVAGTTKYSTVGYVVFAWDNTTANYKSYSDLKNQVVNVVDPPTTSATLTTFQIVPSLGQISLTFACDQSSIFYYAFQVFGSSNVVNKTLTFDMIKKATLDAAMTQTKPDKNAGFLVQGYEFAYTAAQSVTRPFAKITRSRDFYVAVGFCANMASNVTTTSIASTSWNQTDNNGYPVITNITFSKPLSQAQVQSSCKAFGQATFMPCERTVCPDASSACGSTSANSTRRRMRVLQAVCTGMAGCETCSSTTVCTKCNATSTTPYLFSNASGCAASCVAPETTDTVNKKCIAASTKTSYYFTTLPDPFVAKDTSYTDVTAAVANTADFNKIFSANAGLGTITFDAPSVLPQITAALVAPILLTPAINVTGETSATFSANLSNTDGFIYAGVGSSTDTLPTYANVQQRKSGNGTAFITFGAAFASKAKITSISFTGLTSATPYQVFYTATNQDPLGSGFTTPAALTFTTQGTAPGTGPKTGFASHISTTFYGLLALLFALFMIN